MIARSLSRDVKPVLLLGVSGGVAAYKAVDLASGLSKAGYEVHTVLSDAACEFVRPLSFAAVTGQPAMSVLFPDPASAAGEQAYPHLYPATRADVFVLAPATADMIARVAHGMGPDLVSTCALSLPETCLRVFAPAMNTGMWNQPTVQANVRRLQELGWHCLGPASGRLACGAEGPGRMREPADLVADIVALADPSGTAHGPSRPDLAGRSVLILSGPTREMLDPVRFLSNASSGKMGRALAEEAAAAGANVHFVTGPVADANLPVSAAVQVHPVITADEMLRKARSFAAGAEIMIFAAAVADFRPAVCSKTKMPKAEQATTLTLEPTPDIAATLCGEKTGRQIAFGFALQTDDGIAKAREKLVRKGLNGIVLNDPEALGGDDGAYTFLAGPDGATVDAWGQLSKSACARRLLAEAANRLPSPPAT